MNCFGLITLDDIVCLDDEGISSEFIVAFLIMKIKHFIAMDGIVIKMKRTINNNSIKGSNIKNSAANFLKIDFGNKAISKQKMKK